MSGLPWICKPIIHLAQSTWYMLSRNVMKERRGRKAGVEERMKEGMKLLWALQGMF